eukprot:2342454-Rhodomonas_salina.3
MSKPRPVSPVRDPSKASATNSPHQQMHLAAESVHIIRTRQPAMYQCAAGDSPDTVDRALRGTRWKSMLPQ